MAKKATPVHVPVIPQIKWTTEMIEERRKELFPTFPPLTLRQLKERKNKTKN